MQRIGSKRNWMDALAGEDDLVIRTELVGGVGKYGRLLGWLYLGTPNPALMKQ